MGNIKEKDHSACVLGFNFVMFFLFLFFIFALQPLNQLVVLE